MPAPALIIGLALGGGGAAYLLVRWPRLAGALTTGVAVLLLGLALALPIDQPLAGLGGLVFRSTWAVLGRTLEVEAVDRLALAYLALQAALLFAGSGVARAGRYYYSMGLIITGLLSAALFVKPFLFAAIFLEVAAALGVFMLADRDHPSTRGALRFLVFMTLGMPFILFSGWLLEGSAANPGDVSFLVRASFLLAAGFAVLLAVVPFHSWLPVVGQHAPPMAAAFVFTVVQFAVVFLMLAFLDSLEWLRENAAVFQALTVAGGGMALAGTVFAFGQRNFGRSLGYVMMIDIGALLMAVGLGTAAGIQAALAVLAMRGLALPIWGMGLDALRRAAGGDDFDSLRGWGRRQPFASAAVIFGMLSLVGFPLTAGFPARWALMRLLMQIHPTGGLLLLAGMASVGVVCSRGLAALVTPQAEDEPEAGAWSERPAAAVVYGLGVIVILALGAMPQFVLPTIGQMASVFSRLGR